MTLYRIYTEAKPDLDGIVANLMDGATITYGEGLYKGAYENAAVIEYIAPDTRESDELVSALAAEIARVNEQESVLVLKLPVQSVTEFGRASERKVA